AAALEHLPPGGDQRRDGRPGRDREGHGKHRDPGMGSDGSGAPASPYALSARALPRRASVPLPLDLTGRRYPSWSTGTMLTGGLDHETLAESKLRQAGERSPVVLRSLPAPAEWPLFGTGSRTANSERPDAREEGEVTISTRDLSRLPDIDGLRQLLQ